MPSIGRRVDRFFRLWSGTRYLCGIRCRSELIFAKGYGYSNLENKVRTKTDTIYSVCSISKLFTSIGIMQLRDSGILTLRDPIERHLEWFDIEKPRVGAGPCGWPS